MSVAIEIDGVKLNVLGSFSVPLPLGLTIRGAGQGTAQPSEKSCKDDSIFQDFD